MKIFFCYNQHSYILACAASKNYPGLNLIVISQSRVSIIKDSPTLTVKYNPLLGLAVLMLASLFRGIEVILPHAKGGRILRKIAISSKKISFIDDGMDTFRDEPKNFEINLIRPDSNFYMYDYTVPVAAWLSSIDIVRVCGIEELLRDPKPIIKLNNYDCLIVESPGVCLKSLSVDEFKIFCVKHPSYVKNQDIYGNIDSASGREYSIEKTIMNFDGDVIVGESVVLIFLIQCLIDLSKIHIHLSRASFDNLSCLHGKFSICGSLRIG